MRPINDIVDEYSSSGNYISFMKFLIDNNYYIVKFNDGSFFIEDIWGNQVSLEINESDFNVYKLLECLRKLLERQYMAEGISNKQIIKNLKGL